MKAARTYPRESRRTALAVSAPIGIESRIGPQMTELRTTSPPARADERQRDLGDDIARRTGVPAASARTGRGQQRAQRARAGQVAADRGPDADDDPVTTRCGDVHRTTPMCAWAVERRQAIKVSVAKMPTSVAPMQPQQTEQRASNSVARAMAAGRRRGTETATRAAARRARQQPDARFNSRRAQEDARESDGHERGRAGHGSDQTDRIERNGRRARGVRVSMLADRIDLRATARRRARTRRGSGRIGTGDDSFRQLHRNVVRRLPCADEDRVPETGEALRIPPMTE